MTSAAPSARAGLVIGCLAGAVAGLACPSPRARTADVADASAAGAPDGAGAAPGPDILLPAPPARPNEADAAGGGARAALEPAPPPARAPDRGKGSGDGALPVEEGEREPRSQTVTIKLLVEPPKRAHVFWGPKDLGLAPLEVKRPRGSGPLDLVLRAPGFLTLHTRAYTDRDDSLTIRLAAEADAPRFFGYRPPEAKAPAKPGAAKPATAKPAAKTGKDRPAKPHAPGDAR